MEISRQGFGGCSSKTDDGITFPIWVGNSNEGFCQEWLLGNEAEGFMSCSPGVREENMDKLACLYNLKT